MKPQNRSGTLFLNQKDDWLLPDYRKGFAQNIGLNEKGGYMTSSFDIEAARANLRKATEKHRALIFELHQKATIDYERIVQMITQKYNPLRIWQWGSLLDVRSFTEISDIDIGLEGIPDAPMFFSLMGDAMALTDFPLDIVQMEKIEPEFADIIRTKGRIVYERTR